MNRMKELKDFIAECKPKTISYLSENQDLFCAADPCNLCFEFSYIAINESPSIIYLTNGKSSMRLEQISMVEIDYSLAPIGVIIKVHCGSKQNHNNCVYTLLAS